MNRKDYEDAIRKEIESWPGVGVEFANPTGKGHPKAKLTFTPAEGDPLLLSVTYPGTPGDAMRGVHNTLADIRRAAKKIGATRTKPAPSAEEDEAPYRKPNPGREKRPDPVKGEAAEPKPDLVDQLVQAGAISAEEGEAARTAPVQDVFVIGTGDEPEAPLVAQVVATIDRSADPTTRQIKDVLLAELEERIASIVDGVYFDLPDDVYHAVPRLSASGLQKLCVSPATFWRGSWLDPERPPLDEEQTLAQMLGKAYHKARLEPDLFPLTYVRELDKREHPDALFTADQMKAVCEDIGLTKTGTKDVLADRLIEHGYSDRLIWTVAEREWELARKGRIPLPAKHYDQMAIDMDRVSQNGEVAELLSEGFAEVSIFWTDEFGIPMKARIDWLALRHWADFKTFDNSKGSPLEEAIVNAFRYNRYYIQATSYRDAVEAVRVGGLDIVGEATDAQRAFIAKLRMAPHELACHYVFQEKKGIPNLLSYEFPFYMVPFSTIFHEQATDDESRRAAAREITKNKTRLFMKGLHEVVAAKKEFALYCQVYEPGTPWFPLKPRRELNDDMFNTYWIEGR